MLLTIRTRPPLSPANADSMPPLASPKSNGLSLTVVTWVHCTPITRNTSSTCWPSLLSISGSFGTRRSMIPDRQALPVSPVREEELQQAIHKQPERLLPGCAPPPYQNFSGSFG